ncbi:MAG TPA: hypothetical protein VL443_29945 [Cyclobacteriaceae bacterium]|jgi:hypothetical protein|nr:hypothetical protein [Cyclobacteriaceae bacterium]
MIYIVDDIGKVVQSIRTGTTNSQGKWIGGQFLDYNDDDVNGAPYYMYGHRQEISNRLTAKDIDNKQKKKKFPLIALKLDTIETVRGNVVDFKLNLVIATWSDPNLTADERYVKTFKPILYPLYEKFLTQLGNAGLFQWDSSLPQNVPPHTKVDRPFWGTPTDKANIANIFNDPTDAIEIIDLRLSRIDTNC